MGPTEIAGAITALSPLIEMLVTMGLPGIVLLALALPVVSIVSAFLAAFALTHRHSTQMRELVELYREDTRRMLDEEAMRHAEVAARHAEVVAFYNNNTSVVKNYERLLEVNQQLLVNNTRALERLTTIIEARGI